MRSIGMVLAIVGVVVVVLAALNYFALHFLATVSHGTIILGVVGVVLALVGGVMSRQGGAKSA